jgi:D-sedoheptulose 7-phosphate isomerase
MIEKIKGVADVFVVVPTNGTYLVQELHLPIYHCLCAMLEEEYF